MCPQACLPCSPHSRLCNKNTDPVWAGGLQGEGYWQTTTARAEGLLQAAGGIHQLAFRGEHTCIILQMLSPQYDGRGDDTGISTRERQLALPGWVLGARKYPGSEQVWP